MNTIKVMDEILANKIAAGEVVERCLNVVKELVENSIDANSTEIKINLIDSGTKKIVVSDNGIGMNKEDALLAFSRHATSKLKNLDDLFNIETLGFRGEALPSIASVSHVFLQTSKDGVGTSVTLNGGVIENVENSDLSIGTTIEVRDLSGAILSSLTIHDSISSYCIATLPDTVEFLNIAVKRRLLCFQLPDLVEICHQSIDSECTSMSFCKEDCSILITLANSNVNKLTFVLDDLSC